MRVFWASASPFGTDISTVTPRCAYDVLASTSCTVSVNICVVQGDRRFPTDTGSPFLVTTPTPMPRLKCTPGCSLHVTRAQISALCVTSGSSPHLDHAAISFVCCVGARMQPKSDQWPSGQTNASLRQTALVDEGIQAPFVAAAAQAPVV